MSDLIIREARAEDFDQWVEMRTALWPESRENNPHELQAYFAGRSTDIEQAYVVKSGKGQLVGFIELNIRNFAEGSVQPRAPYLEAWYVHPESRHEGVGRQLIARAEQWARDQGCSELASDTTPDNHRSIELHNRLGFKETERVVCFLKPHA